MELNFIPNIKLWGETAVLTATARIILSITLIQSLIFSPIVTAEQLSLPANDMTAPEISHTPINGVVKQGSSQKIAATVTDDSGVKTVTLYYRDVGASHYERKAMKRALDSNEYSAAIKISDNGVQYYIQAEDVQGNTVLNGYSFSPFTIRVAKAGEENNTGAAAGDNAFAGAGKEESGSNMKWVWIGLGLLAAGALAGGGGGGGSSSKSGGSTVTVDAPLP